MGIPLAVDLLAAHLPSMPPMTVPAEGLDYDLVRLLKYEWASRADHAKKLLEHDRVLAHLHRLGALPRQIGAVSLDIGCATGRYPAIFADMGFRAIGWDTSPQAVALSRYRVRGHGDVVVDQRDLLVDPPEPDSVSVITCMMGTFNHLGRGDQERFIAIAARALRPGGVMVASSWNPACTLGDLLQIYTPEEQAVIATGCRPAGELLDLLAAAGFEDGGVLGAAYAPDRCYDAWLGQMSEPNLLALDQGMAEHLPVTAAQLLVFAGVKPMMSGIA